MSYVIINTPSTHCEAPTCDEGYFYMDLGYGWLCCQRDAVELMASGNGTEILTRIDAMPDTIADRCN